MVGVFGRTCWLSERRLQGEGDAVSLGMGRRWVPRMVAPRGRRMACEHGEWASVPVTVRMARV
jgi:hypothetical protein